MLVPVVEIPVDEEVRKLPPDKGLPELQVGGPGSGLPPPFYVATGKQSHALVGIDLGSRYGRVSGFVDGEWMSCTPVAVPSTINFRADQAIGAGLGAVSRPGEEVLGDLRPLLGSDWSHVFRGEAYTAEDLTVFLLRSLKSCAERCAAKVLSKAVLTVPTCYTSLQRAALRRAAECCNIEVLQLVNESTAAAVYHLCGREDFNGLGLVFQMGATHSAVSLFSFTNGILEVKATRASATGGDIMDRHIVDWFFQAAERENGMRVPRTRDNIMWTRAGAEDARIKLDMLDDAAIGPLALGVELPCASGHYEATGSVQNLLSRNLFEQLCITELMKLRSQIFEVLDEARVSPEEVQLLIKSGNVTATPAIRQMLFDIFGTADSVYYDSDTAAVSGAGLLAGVLAHDLRDFCIWDVLAAPVGVAEGEAFVPSVRLNSPLPITGYYRCASPDSTVNVEVFQGSSLVASENSPLCEVTVNNCPPTAEKEEKVEIVIKISADGIVDVGARHVELNVNLPVTVREAVAGTAGAVAFPELYELPPAALIGSGQRLSRLARMLNLPEHAVVNILIGRGYSLDSIKDGTAVERMIRGLRAERKSLRRRVAG